MVFIESMLVQGVSLGRAENSGWRFGRFGFVKTRIDRTVSIGLDAEASIIGFG